MFIYENTKYLLINYINKYILGHIIFIILFQLAIATFNYRLIMF